MLMTEEQQAGIARPDVLMEEPEPYSSLASNYLKASNLEKFVIFEMRDLFLINREFGHILNTDWNKAEEACMKQQRKLFLAQQEAQQEEDDEKRKEKVERVERCKSKVAALSSGGPLRSITPPKATDFILGSTTEEDHFVHRTWMRECWSR